MEGVFLGFGVLGTGFGVLGTGTSLENKLFLKVDGPNPSTPTPPHPFFAAMSLNP